MSRPSNAILCMSDFLRLGNTLTITSNQKELNLRTWALANGWNGSSAINIEVASGVYIWSGSQTIPAIPALVIDGSWPNGVTLINNGFIIGRGGNAVDYGGTTVSVSINPGLIDGGTAISLGVNCTIQNNSYIAAGGGSGGRNGGGGAGGGNASNGSNAPELIGYGGNVGEAGKDGGVLNVGYGGAPASADGGSGGGGGRILPGIGGASVSVTVGQVAGGKGGGAGGGGGAAYVFDNTTSYRVTTGGGGGGWGAAGGNGYRLVIPAVYSMVTSGAGGSANNNGSNGENITIGHSTDRFIAGGVGGKAVALNGYSVTWLSFGTRWGAIS